MSVEGHPTHILLRRRCAYRSHILAFFGFLSPLRPFLSELWRSVLVVLDIDIVFFRRLTSLLMSVFCPFLDISTCHLHFCPNVILQPEGSHDGLHPERWLLQAKHTRCYDRYAIPSHPISSSPRIYTYLTDLFA